MICSCGVSVGDVYLDYTYINVCMYAYIMALCAEATHDYNFMNEMKCLSLMCRVDVIIVAFIFIFLLLLPSPPPPPPPRE